MKKVLLIFGLLLSVPCFATDFPVHSGGNIQTAINSAASAGVGSTVTIDAGAAFTPQILTLPIVTGCTSGQYVTIRTSNFSSLPAGRVAVSDATNMPKITRTGTDIGGLFFLAPGTNGGCYYLLGLEITTDAVNQMTFPLVNFQDTGSAHLVVDRCYIHSAEGSTGRTAPYNSSIGLGGVLSDGTDVTVENSYINGMWGLPLGALAGSTMTQSSAIIADVGPCNSCLWTNNYLEGGYSHIQMGGAPQFGVVGATVSGSPAPTVNSATLSSVSGITVNMPIALQVPWSSAYCKRDNTHPCWGDGVVTSIVGSTVNYTTLFGEDASSNRQATAAPQVGGNVIWAGTQLANITITRNWMNFNYAFEYWLRFTSGNFNHDKGFMEIKNGNNLDIEANVFGNWGGWPSVFGLGNEQNQVGDSPFATQSNITIKNNWLRAFKHCTYFGDSVAGGYIGFLNTASVNLDIENNLCEGPDTLAIDGSPADAIVFNVGKNFTYKHNTALVGYPNIYSASAMSFDQNPVAAYGSAWTPATTIKDSLIGWGNYGVGCSSGALSTCLGTLTDLDNIFALCGAAACSSPDNPVSDGIFPHSTAVSNWTSILFTNAAGHVWSLTPSSPGYHAASDGKDVGVDFGALSTATAGVVPGGGATFTLSVNSSNPSSGVAFTVTPADNNGVASGTTPAVLVYNSGASPAVTVSATNFANWTCPSPSANVCTVPSIATNTTIVANYNPTTFNVAINTVGAASVTVNYTPHDNSGGTSCTSNCSGINFNSSTLVQFTFPTTASGNNLTSITGCDSVSGNLCNKVVNANVTIMGTYTTPAPPNPTVPPGKIPLNLSVPNGATIMLDPADANGTNSGTLFQLTNVPYTLTITVPPPPLNPFPQQQGPNACPPAPRKNYVSHYSCTESAPNVSSCSCK